LHDSFKQTIFLLKVIWCDGVVNPVHDKKGII